MTHLRPSRRVEINTDVMSRARAALGVSYPKLAAVITEQGHRVSAPRLCQIERGQGSPSPDLFSALARALRITEHELKRAA